jgi:hypothetical protein
MMMQPRPYHYTRRIYTSRAPQRQTFQAQGEALAQKALVNVTGAALTRIAANAYCRSPYPDYALCRTLDDLANQQASKANDSVLAVSVWGGIALVAVVLGEVFGKPNS